VKEIARRKKKRKEKKRKEKKRKEKKRKEKKRKEKKRKGNLFYFRRWQQWQCLFYFTMYTSFVSG
jgi:hypothetical protein